MPGSVKPPPAPRDVPLLDAAATADLLGVSVRTVQRYFTIGKFPTVQVGGRRMVPTAWLHNWMQLPTDNEGWNTHAADRYPDA